LSENFYETRRGGLEMNLRKLLMVSLAAVFFFAAVPGFSADVNELERRLDIVSEELDRLKSSGGSSDGIAHRTSVHGYGETHWSDEQCRHLIHLNF
jgi:hypothetical protein